MRPYFEHVLSGPGESFNAYEVRGAVIPCIYHQHREFELTCVVSSFGCRLINDSFASFDAGTLNLIGPLVPHHYWSSPEDSRSSEWGVAQVVQFPESFAAMELFRLPEFSAVRQMLADSRLGLEFDREACAPERLLLAKLVAQKGPRRLVLLLELLERLSRRPFRQLSRCQPPQISAIPAERISRVLQLIHGGLDAGTVPALSECAAKIGLCPEGFSRFFRKSTGKSFVQYLTELRIGKAENLLLHSDMQIAEICYASGFSTLSNFNRHFRRLRGCSPGEFRHSIRSATTKSATLHL